MALVRLRRDPWGAVETLHDELANLMSAPFGAWPVLRGKLSLPSTDVWEDDGDVVVESEVPGMEAKDIDVNIRDDNTLVISAKKEETKEKKEKNYYRSERYFGEYYREIELPKPVDKTKVSAKTRDGVLTVRLAKKAGTAEKETKIRVE
jgi:HSP20 family protein